MAETTIEWTRGPNGEQGYTFNPWIGCTKVSPCCDHCYAETQNKHRKWTDRWGPKGTRKRTSPANWKKPLAWNRKAKREGVRPRVFCASLADVFDDHPSIKPEWRDELWSLIKATPNLDWLLLTKRPENIADMLPDDWACGWADSGANVWLGVTVENQEMANVRLPYLWSLGLSGWHIYVSYEPALGPIVWRPWLAEGFIDWVIVGGEKGPKARPMNEDWVRSLRNQCHATDVPFFYKQRIENGRKIKMPTLDGRVWDQVPG